MKRNRLRGYNKIWNFVFIITFVVLTSLVDCYIHDVAPNANKRFSIDRFTEIWEGKPPLKEERQTYP